VVFVHPQRPPVSGMPEYAFPAGYTELTFDTTRAVTNMLYTGMLEKFRNIRFIMPHMGGVTPFLLFRLGGLDDDPKLKDKVPAGVKTYLNRLYYDIAQSPSPLALRALLDIADPSRIMFGTDYPSARHVEKVMADTIANVKAFDGYDDTLRAKVMAGNAKALLPRFAGVGQA
jgi:predicted TIM-barrel fold metal-dependent hydrolase